MGLRFRAECTHVYFLRAAAIVPKALFERDVLLFFTAFQDGLPPAVVHIGWRDVSDPFVIPPVIVKLDELPDRLPQLLWNRVHQQIYARLRCLVEAFEFSVRLRMMR